MDNWPRISIVVPSFNSGKTLSATLKSIVDQEYPNLELIVVDGGSTDNSVDVIKQFEKHITWWESENDKGSYDAVAKGFSRATGEIFAWIGADDTYLPHALLTVGDVMKSLPQVQWLTSMNHVITDYSDHVIRVDKAPGYSRLAFLDGRHLFGERGYLGFIQQESTFWRSSLWKQSGGFSDKESYLAGDFELWTKFFDLADLYAIESLFGAFRLRQGQLSSDLNKYIEQARPVLASMRKRNTWSRNPLRELAYKFDLGKVPGFRKIVRLTLGYLGLQVVRRNCDSSKGVWEITKVRYL